MDSRLAGRQDSLRTYSPGAKAALKRAAAKHRRRTGREQAESGLAQLDGVRADREAAAIVALARTPRPRRPQRSVRTGRGLREFMGR